MNFMYISLEMEFLSQNNSVSDQLMTPPRPREMRVETNAFYKDSVRQYRN